MKKQKKEKNQYLQTKQQQTNFQKILSTLYRFFIKETKLSHEISLAVVTASYFQIFSIVNIIVLFTVFSNTNSSTYSIVIGCLCVVLFLVDIFPKISKNHLVFNFVSVSQGLILIGIIISSKILLDNYYTFVSHCKNFTDYYSTRIQIIGPKDEILNMCSSISMKFVAQIIVQAVFVIGKIIHVILYVRAYRQAKQKFDEDQKKRRRKDRYNQMIRRRYIFNQQRKV